MLPLRDTAHELGLGFFAGSHLALADVSMWLRWLQRDFRNYRADYAVARGESVAKRRADGHHGACDRCRRCRHHPRLRAGRADGVRWKSRDSPVSAGVAAACCIDDLAGDRSSTPREGTVRSAESAASASPTRLPDQSLTGSGRRLPRWTKARFELFALRRAVERDRYGLMASVLMAPTCCTPSSARLPLARRQSSNRAEYGRSALTRP